MKNQNQERSETTCSNYIKFPLFTFCFIILFNFTVTKPLLAHSFFYKQTKSTINLEDNETLQREWLETQPRFIRHDIHVSDKTVIPELLKYFNIHAYLADYSPGYNAPGSNTTNCWIFKDPPKGLLCCYFKKRDNPFNIEYPHADDKYTLDDLLQYEIAIEEAFVFWDASVKPQTIEPKIHFIKQDIYADENIEENVNGYLLSNKIISQPKRIEPHCYNATHNTGMVVPLPTNIYRGKRIDAIYFDAGIRVLPPNTATKTYTIEDLIKQSNGAKNVYLFIFNVIPRPKETKIIELPANPDPYTAIRTWKRDNNLYSYPPLTKENDFVTEKKFFWVNYTQVSQQFETENVIYKVVCDNLKYVYQLSKEYDDNLKKWQNQCYIKKNCSYNGVDIRNKFGEKSKWIYDSAGDKHWYQYNVGWAYDDWRFLGNYFAYAPYDSLVFTKTPKIYDDYYDTTPPPKKPKELE